MLAIEAKFRIQFRPSAPQELVRRKRLLIARHQARDLQIFCPLFFKIAWHRFPETICITLSRSDSPGQGGRRVNISGFFLTALMCAIICAKWAAALSIIRFRNTAIFQSLILRKGGRRDRMRSLGCECSKTNSRDAEYKACSVTWVSASLLHHAGLMALSGCNRCKLQCG